MKFKQKYNIGKVLSLAGLMMLANACNKERDVIFDGVFDREFSPSKEQIKNEIDKKNVRTVFINFNEMNLTGWSPAHFRRARDTLQTRLDIAPGRVRGMGTIYVDSQSGAHMPDVTDTMSGGMALEDSLWYTANGWKVQRLHPEWAK